MLLLLLSGGEGGRKKSQSQNFFSPAWVQAWLLSEAGLTVDGFETQSPARDSTQRVTEQRWVNQRWVTAGL